MDKDATIVFLDRFTVRVAGVVDPTRFVPADLGVDDVGAIIDPKKKCVRIVHIGRNTFPRDAATRVFNDPPALSDGSGRENTSTVNSRLTHLNERHGEEAHCASVNGYLFIDYKEQGARQGEQAVPSSQELGKKHRHTVPIGGVGFGAELLAEEAFLQTRFDPKTDNDQKRADDRVEIGFQDGDSHRGEDDPAVNGMTHNPIWAGVDDPVLSFAGDKGGPEFSKVKSSPPGECEPDPS
jgi:hypothetical protein